MTGQSIPNGLKHGSDKLEKEGEKMKKAASRRLFSSGLQYSANNQQEMPILLMSTLSEFSLIT